MKKAIVVILLLAAVLLLCATASAEKPVNPDQAEVWFYEHRPRPEAPDGAPDSTAVRLSVACQTAPTLGGKGVWSVSLKSPYTSSSVKSMRFILSMKDWCDSYTPVYSVSSKSYKSSFTSCQIVTAGAYRLEVWAEYTDGQAGYDEYDFTIQDDDSHTSLTEKVSAVAGSCKGSTQWETALNLHDWLVTHVYYDQNLEYYGADLILRGYGVCDGYTKAFCMLCQKAGIPVRRIVGGDHAWNAVQLDGQWYYVDCTWDDPLGLGNETSPKSGAETRTYFCLNKTLMQLDHTGFSWENSSEQSCTSLAANYIVHSGEWKAWGSYDWNYETNGYMVTTLLDEVRGTFTGGKTVCDIQWSKWSEGGGIWMWYLKGGELCGVPIDERNQAILEYALQQETFELDGEPILVKAEKTSGGMTITFRGWDIKETGTLTLPLGIGTVPAEAFRGVRATTLVIQPGCTRIAAGAFRNSKIRYATIPDTVTSISENAFDGCGKIIFYTTSKAAIRYAEAHGFLVMDP